MPTAKGTSTASVIQTTRTVQLGTQPGSGTKAKTHTAIFGAAMPSRRIGQTAAAATRADSMVFSPLPVWPKRATTAQPKIADRMRPTDRLASVIRAWIMATFDPPSKAAASDRPTGDGGDP